MRPALVGVELNVMDSQGRRFPLSSAGTGRSRRISLALWESSNELLGQHDATQTPESDVVFVYDEPDTHLDYSHQRRIMALIQLQSSRPNARVIVATHSLNLIDGVDISSVVHLRTQEGRVRVEVLSEDSADKDVRRHLSTIATTLGFRNSVLLHERFFVAVEGVSETSAFPILFRKHAGFPIQSAGICLWAGGSNEGALRFARFLKDHGRDVAFVVDKDSRTNQKHVFRDDKLKEHGFDLKQECLYLGSPNELEDLFTNDDWAETANALWKPKAERGPWQPQEIEELRAGKFSSQLLNLLKGGSLNRKTRKTSWSASPPISPRTASPPPCPQSSTLSSVARRTRGRIFGSRPDLTRRAPRLHTHQPLLRRRRLPRMQTGRSHPLRTVVPRIVATPAAAIRRRHVPAMHAYHPTTAHGAPPVYVGIPSI